LNPLDKYISANRSPSGKSNQQDQRFALFKAIDTQTKKEVFIKSVKAQGTSLHEISKLSHEFKILNALNHEGIPKPIELINSGQTVALVLDSFEYEPLKDVLLRGPLPLDTFFNIAIEICDALKYVHNEGILHRDINPSNIFISSDGHAKLMEFGIATKIQSEENEKINLDLIEGSLTYMSPERTGRTSYVVSDSSDLYSLGISFYEMLSGKPPFDSSDPLEIIHFHLSRKPVSLKRLNKKLPDVICAIVEKLIEKTPDTRYQSCESLLSDLLFIQDAIEKGLDLDSFKANAKRTVKRYLEPQKLYGREPQIAQLLKSFEDLAYSKSSLLLVSGYAGIGKSVLVKQVQQPIIKKKAIFISGKFDQFKRNIPYFSFIEAFNDLITSLLSQSEEQNEYWRERLTSVLGDNAGLIIEVIPYLEKIIGKQHSVPKLQPAESEFRFRSVMLDFVYAFSSQERPLVIFLDDLQWADLPSLNLIERILVTPGESNIFIIGAYRDNEVNELSPLAITIQQLKSTSVVLNEIQLRELDEKTTTQLVADSFGMNTKQAKELGNIAFRKTSGNPFFINRFLKSLYNDKFVKYDGKEWGWEKDKIEALDYADNVVDLMSRELTSLPEATQETIKSAAVLGNTFNLKELALIMGKTQREVFENLNPAFESGYLIPIDNNYRNLTLDIDELEASLKKASDKMLSNFKFMHDRVQQAAYALIPAEERDFVHVQTGRILYINTIPKDLTFSQNRAQQVALEHIPEDELKSVSVNTGRVLYENTHADDLSDSIFTIVGHFANGLHLITDKEEKLRLLELFLLAGQKAKDSTSYDLSVVYLTNALKLNKAFGWEKEYQLTYDIYLSLGESEFLNTNHDKALEYFDELLKYSKTKLEKLEIYYVQSSLYLKLSRTSESIELGRKAMQLFGINFPVHPLAIKVKALMVLAKYFWQFTKNSKRAASLIHEDECKNREIIEINKFLVDMQSCAYQENQDLMLVLIFKGVDNFLKYGYTDSSAFAFSSFGVVTLSKLGLAKKGFSLWDLTADLSPRTKSDFMKGKIDYILGAFSTHWRYPVGDGLDHILETIKKCTVNGDPHFAGYAITNYISKKMAAGYPIEEVLEWSIDKVDYLKRNKHFSGLDFSAPKMQLLKALAGQSPKLKDWNDSDFKDDDFVKSIRETGNQSALGHFYCTKVTMLYYFDRYNEAIQTSDKGWPAYDYIVGQWLVPEWEFFKAMSIAGALSGLPAGEKRKRLRDFKRSLRLMKKWAKDCPINFNGFLYLLQAEHTSIHGEFNQVVQLYEKAIEACSDAGFIQIEAIANKRAAIYLERQGHQKMASIFMRSAYDLFKQWGAYALCEILENDYTHLLGIELNTIESSSRVTTEQLVTPNQNLDLGSILKASQTIASQVKLNELMLNLMYIVIENAGAQRGCLLLERKGELCIEAEGNSGPKGNRIIPSKPFAKSGMVPESVINYAWRMDEDVVINKAQSNDNFNTDSFVRKNKILSMLCLPISEKGKKIGLLYMENRLIEGVFTEDRLELLNLLSGQIGISIQNAMLYENLEEKVQERTEEISKQQVRIEEEMKKSDDLLLNILPERTALDLKTKGYTEAVTYPNAIVMFCDIVGFTSRVENMAAKDVVDNIHQLFSAMDDIMKKFQIEKIKTIGDAYMCAGGLHEHSSAKAAQLETVNIIEAAKDVLKFVDKYNEKLKGDEKNPLALRIGINSGPVVAGVVGKTKFAYDIWGDTVNTASRMESAGEPGKINVTHDVYETVKDQFSFTSRGKIAAKNKGLIDMYFVE
jgi:predicted ATPase/class 3 adenylate cyclase